MIFLGLIFLLLAASAHADDRCVMRGECGIDDVTGLNKPCVYDGSAVPLEDPAAQSIVNDLCPNLITGPNFAVCCDLAQVTSFNTQLGALAALYKRCPSCYHNLANLFCQLVCSPKQSSFLQVIASSNKSVDEINYYITEHFTTGLFDSCKNVKLSFTTSPAIGISCGSHSTDCTPHLWLEFMGGHDPSPYQINFQFETEDKVVVKGETSYPMNETVIPCSQSVGSGGAACSCVDCPCHPEPPPPPPKEDDHCVMRGECGIDDVTGLNKPCVYDGSAVPLEDPAAQSIVNDLCPNLITGPNFAVCCDLAQVTSFNTQLGALAALYKRCPSCYHNLANLFCQLVCSPKQSSFLQVIASSNKSVDEINYYITEHFTTGLFDSCKNVKLSFTTSPAIGISCGSHSTDCTPHLWLEFMGGHDPSPYQINFQFETEDKVVVKGETSYPMNETIIPCSQPVGSGGAACSCVDCTCHPEPPPPPPKEDDHCVMRGECGIDEVTGLNKPCVYDGSAVPLEDPAAQSIVNDLCPNLITGPNFAVCCDLAQVTSFNTQLGALAALYKRCPSCYHNLANLFCQLVCSPKQSSFLQVIASSNKSVDEINYYITEHFTTGLFDSCKNVKLSFTTSPAIGISCGSHSTDCTPHLWLEFMGGHDPSPYQINFQFETEDKVVVKGETSYPMNETIIPCSQPVGSGGAACSCVDCTCHPEPPPPPPKEDDHCVMRGECGIDEVTGLNKPCVYDGSAVPLEDPAAQSIVNDLCPNLITGPNFAVCCDLAQVTSFNTQLGALAALYKRCPSCYHNLANLFCQLVCSPKQSSFLQVIASSNKSVDEINYYITEHFTTGLFDSCKNVKLSFTTSPAIGISCGSHSTDCTPHLWLEFMGGHDPSPYQINFQFETEDKVVVKGETSYPMNETIIPCSQPVGSGGAACSCVDCTCHPEPPPPPPKEDDHCVMRGECGIDEVTGLNKPCVYDGSAVPLEDPAAQSIVNDLCPNLITGPNFAVCCDLAQVTSFNTQLGALAALYKRCPSCYHNLANLFCQLVCSPKQSSFLQVIASSNKSVDEINYYITEHFTTGLFDSCKNVKLSFTTSPAIGISCGSHSTDCTPHLWLEFMGGHDPSPYQINFQFETEDKVVVKGETSYPMNETIIPCSQPVGPGGAACSCVDCPCHPEPPPPPPKEDDHCVMRGECGIDEVTGLNKPCVYDGSAVPLEDPAAQSIVNDLCPNLITGPNFAVCCDLAQVTSFNTQLGALAALYKRCPSCYHNLANLFCQLVCSPKQSSFLQVIASSNKSVDEINYYITEHFTTGLFDSCKNVKLSFTTSPAIGISCGSHSTDCTPHLWLEFMGGHDPSPYQINFQFETEDKVVVKGETSYPMNETIIPCSQPVGPGGAACSCVDCPCHPEPPPPPPKEDDHCVMRGECGIDEVTGLNKPCVYDGSAVPLEDPAAQSIVNGLCPNLITGPNFAVCCDLAQVTSFNTQLGALAALYKRCPSCYHNLANLFCQLVCSPKQSSFLQVIASSNKSVDEINYYITEHFTTGLFDSCKNVKLSFTTSPAIGISCGSHSTDCTPHLWLEFMGDHDPSPYQINFQFETEDKVVVKGETSYPMNETIIPCSQPVGPGGAACSCVDCPCHPEPPPPPPKEDDHCVMRGECGIDEVTGLNKPCVYDGSAVPLEDPAAQSIVNNLCPNLITGPNFAVCCDLAQVTSFNTQLGALAALYKRCPSCYHNLANLFCQLVCSPKQRSFLQVIASSNKSVDEINYYITEHFTTGLFDSCKNVKLSFTTSPAIGISCGSHSTDCTPHLWLEFMEGHDPSPYQINFQFETEDKVVVKGETSYPMNETIIPCSQPVGPGGAACSCVDCPCHPEPPPPPPKEDDHCVMRGECGIDEVTGLNKPCVYDGSAVPLEDPAAQSIVNNLCPNLITGPNFAVCCDLAQVTSFNTQLGALAALYKRCPSCYHNLANLFCQLVCSPKQSSFLQVIASSNKSVDEINYYITEHYTTGLFDSCKNVKLSFTTSPAIGISCGSHSTDCTPHLWLEFMGGHDPSPYQINFQFETEDKVVVKGETSYPMNETIIPCSQPVGPGGAACSCVDCPCHPEPPPPPPKDAA